MRSICLKAKEIIVDTLRGLFATTHRHLTDPSAALMKMITGAWLSQAICTAASLRIADSLAHKALTANELADRVGVDVNALKRLMRLLVSHGIFSALSGNKYALTELGDLLRSDSNSSLNAYARFVGNTAHWAIWGQFLHSVKTANAATLVVHEHKFFDYLKTDKVLASAFHGAMENISNMSCKPIADAFDFSRFSTIVDVGGGYGRLLAEILKNSPSARGILYDLPDVTLAAKKFSERLGLSSRFEIRNGSFFDSVPQGADCYLMKHIIHDWDEESALVILNNIRSSILSNGALLLVEFVLPADERPHPGKLLDMEMLAVFGGQERTREEYSMLLARARFKLKKVMRTTDPLSIAIIEAVPV